MKLEMVILGRSAPERLRDGRETVCVVGYNSDLGLIRLYPTRWDCKQLKRWNIVGVPALKNPDDPREESYKIEGSKRDWDRLNDKIKLVGIMEDGDERSNLIEQLVIPCIRYLNRKKRSLGIINPKEESIGCGIYPRNKIRQLALFALGLDGIVTKDDFDRRPYLRFKCSECETKDGHKMQILEYGFYEWMRKNPRQLGRVFENAHVLDDDYVKYLVVGNSLRRRRSFMIVNVLRFKKDKISHL